MFTMKQTCEQTQLSYETLKFYCNQGLVPNVKRDKIIIAFLIKKILHGSTA